MELKKLLKTIIFSSLISVNIIIWYEILGIDFLRAVTVVILVVLFVVWDR